MDTVMVISNAVYYCPSFYDIKTIRIGVELYLLLMKISSDKIHDNISAFMASLGLVAIHFNKKCLGVTGIDLRPHPHQHDH